MKKAYIDTLTALMRSHNDIITITADMGFSVYENLQKEFPTRFYNTGVTEQASIGFSTGLALSGYTVFFYAQAAFSTMRCFEQVRLDVGYNNLNVKIVGVNAGFSLNQLGVSHFTQEDIGLMRLIPGMTILSPGDPYEMKWALLQAYQIDGPVYIRFSKVGSKDIHKTGDKLKVGHPFLISKGNQSALIVSGGMLELAYDAVKELEKKKIKINLYTMPTVKPIDKIAIRKILALYKNIFVVEEHNIIGALGSAISEITSESASKSIITRIGVPDIFTGVTGSIPYLLDLNGLSVNKINSKILTTLTKRH